MPFTISHAVLAPPISKITGGRLPISALAIGTMTPDLYRLFTSQDYDFTHEWRGIIVPDLLIGLAFCLLWYLLFRPVVFRCIGMVKPLDLHSFDRVCGFILSVCIALIIGIATHLIWDGLTHSDFRTFAFDHFLNHTITLLGHGYPMHRVLQIGTSIIALPILFWMMFKHIQQHQQVTPVADKIKKIKWLLLIISTLGGLLAYARFAMALGLELWHTDLYGYVGRAINHFSSAWLVLFSFGCLIFLILDHRKYFER